jgi:hypothetical protein
MTNAFAQAIESGNYVVGGVCVDCLMGIANGDWPEVGPNWTETQQLVSDETMRLYDVTLGHIHDSYRCWHSGEVCDEDCDCERAAFSWSPCIVCGSSLGGSRDDVLLIDKAVLKA